MQLYRGSNIQINLIVVFLGVSVIWTVIDHSYGPVARYSHGEISLGECIASSAVMLLIGSMLLLSSIRLGTASQEPRAIRTIKRLLWGGIILLLVSWLLSGVAISIGIADTKVLSVVFVAGSLGSFLLVIMASIVYGFISLRNLCKRWKSKGLKKTGGPRDGYPPEASTDSNVHN